MNDETFLDEKIKVLSIFEGGVCRPIKFRRRNGREIVVTEVGLRHPVNNGLKTIHIFEVTDGGTDYRLEFDSERLVWKLTMEADHYDARI